MWGPGVARRIAESKGVIKKCTEVGGHRYCIYKYRYVSFIDFVRDPYAALARGTVVIDGERVVVPFTKFFNWWEIPGLDPSLLGPAKGSYVKLDGTMVAAWIDPYTGDLRANTRGLLWNMAPGHKRVLVDDDGRVLNPFVKGLLHYARENSLLEDLEEIAGRGVAVFELVVPGMPASGNVRNTKYAEMAEKKGVPYLLAVREDGVIRQPEMYEWPLKPEEVDPWEAASKDDMEGAVAWYESIPLPPPLDSLSLDPLLKFKSRAYLLRVGAITGWRSIVALAISGRLDDALGLIPDPKEREALAELVELAGEVEEIVERGREKIMMYTIKPGSPVGALLEGGIKAVLAKHAPKRPSEAVRWMRRFRSTLLKMVGEER